MNIKKITFDEIIPFWCKLWPNSVLQPTSSMVYLGGYDINITKNFAPSFFAIEKDDSVIGVVSGHRSNREFYRLRGIYIDKDYRGRCYSKHLFEAIDIQAKQENCNFVWSFPRKDSLYSYLKANFQQTSHFIDKDIDYGPNCYVLKEV